PVSAGFRQSLLVAVDDVVGIIMKFSQPDESAPLGQVPGAGHGESLGIEVKSRLRILLQETSGAPVVEVFRGTRVDVERGIVCLALAATNDAYQIMRTQVVIAGLHLWSNLVIRLRDDIFQPKLVTIVTKGFEGSY